MILKADDTICLVIPRRNFIEWIWKEELHFFIGLFIKKSCHLKGPACKKLQLVNVCTQNICLLKKDQRLSTTKKILYI